MIFQRSRICSSAFYSRLVSLVGLALFLCFVVGGSDLQAVTLYCRGLYDFRGGSLLNLAWATAEYGGLGGQAGDRQMFPAIADFNAASGGLSYFHYWPKGYTEAQAPVVYSVKPVSSKSITFPDDMPIEKQSEFYSYLLNYGGGEWAKRAALKSVSVTTVDGEYALNIETYKPGTRVGSGVVTLDNQGNPFVSYPDSTGYAPGFTVDLHDPSSYTPVWYDLSQDTPVQLDSLQGVSSSSLTVDPDTGLYNFSVPDYGPQLSTIISGIDSLNNKQVTVDIGDNIQVNVPAPEVTVNPEINVPAPEVTVNVPAPEVTVNVPAPEVTVNVPAPEVTVSTDLTGVESSLDSINDTLSDAVGETDLNVLGFNYEDSVLTDEEQGLVDVAMGWDTQIPVIGDAADMTLNVLAGKIPSMGRSLEVLNGFDLCGYEVNIDWSQYANSLIWFRAFCLLIEVCWFMGAVFSTITNSLQV